MGDSEIDAMASVATALSGLEDDARGRVLRWAAERFGVSVSFGNRPDKMVGSDGAAETEDDTTVKPPPVTYDHFAELFARADPTSDADKALVAAYWLQVIQGDDKWQAGALQKELKNLGHAVGNITRALSSNMQEKPQRIIQLQKAGSTKQARKTYKVTHEGLTYVQNRLRGEAS